VENYGTMKAWMVECGEQGGLWLMKRDAHHETWRSKEMVGNEK
jgi:hypothetical protein